MEMLYLLICVTVMVAGIEYNIYSGLTAVSSFFHDFDNEHKAGATGWQWVLTPDIGEKKPLM